MSTTTANALAAVDGDPLIGRVFAGKYEIEERIGAGSMGAVYRARHLTLDKSVCVKIMLDEVARDPRLARRFEREARAASRLDHPSSVVILDYGREDDGTLYIVMELIEGRDLFELVADGPFSEDRIVDIMTQTLSALAAAHDVGILHRDLKPENIMVTKARADEGGLLERVKVCDFGIAHMADPHAAGGRRITTRGFIVGTPEYMSPEQARAEAPDPRSDLYSVGVIMFQLLTGRLPFEADTPVGVALKHLSEEPPRPRDLNAAAHPALEAICLRALRKLPAERYASAREMRSALRGALFAHRAGAFGDDRETMTEPHLVAREAPLEGDDAEAAPFALARPPRARRDGARRMWRRRVAIVMTAALAFVGVAGVGVTRRHELGPTSRLMATAAAALLDRVEIARAQPIVDAPTSASAAAAASETASAAVTVLRAPSSRVEATVPATLMLAPTPLGPPTRATVASPRAPRPMSRPSAIAPTEPLVLPPAGDAAPPAPSGAAASPPPASPAVTEAMSPIVTRSFAPAAVSPGPETPRMPRYVLESARVEIGAPEQLVGATSMGVERALAPTRGKLDACYRDALPRAGGAIDGVAMLHLETDEVGIVRRASVAGVLASEVGPCIARAVIGGRVRNVDTGTASADLPLTYRSR